MNEKLFDYASEYDALLQKGLKFSGESKDYFALGRVLDMKKTLPEGFHPKRILDFGCGIGKTVEYLSTEYPEAEVTGVDSSQEAIQYAAGHYENSRRLFHHTSQLRKSGDFDLCYMNGVFHHLEPQDRLPALNSLLGVLRPGGYLALFENNPWNLGTRLVMKSIPFDRDVHPIPSSVLKRLLGAAGFACLSTRYLFYFPRFLAFLRPLEMRLARFPLGAQYFILARKAS